MKSPILRITALALAASVLACPRPPAVPTRPAELLPRVELQIDNTATQADDYVGTAATPARIRLLNPMDPPTPVPITLKNLDYQPAPQLVFAPSGTPAASTLDLTLPGDGAWVPFVVAGTAGKCDEAWIAFHGTHSQSAPANRMIMRLCDRGLRGTLAFPRRTKRSKCS